MQKNISGQKLIVFAFDSTTNLPKTGDAANITAYVSKDYGTVTVLGDTSATEMDATNAKGYYLFDLTQAETNGDTLLFSAKSSTSNIVVIAVPATVFTTPANFTALAIDSSGIADSNVEKLLGTAWLTPGTAGTPDVNTKLIGGIVQTGGDIYQAVTNIAATSAALNATAASATYTTGTDSGGVANTTALDGVFDSVTDTAGTVDFYYQFSLGSTGQTAVGVTWDGYVVGVVNTIKVYAYNWGGASWDQVGTIVGISGTTIMSQEWDLTSAHTGTGGNVGLVRIRFNATGLVTSTTKTDRILCGYTIVQTFPANFGVFVIDGSGRVDVGKVGGTTQTAADVGALTTETGADVDELITSVAAIPTNPYTGTPPTVAQIATGLWQDTTAGDFTVAGSIGKSLFTSGNAPGASSGLAIVGSNVGTATSVTGAVGSVTGNVGGNVTGSVGSVAAGGIGLTSFTNAAWAGLGPNYIAFTGTGTLNAVNMIDDYVYAQLYNDRPAFQAISIGTFFYWYSSGDSAWILSTVLGTKGTNYFQSATARPDSTLTGHGTTTGPPEATIGLRYVDLNSTLGTITKGSAGYVAPDWAQVGNQTSTVGLSGTTVGTLTTYTGNTVQTGDSFARLGAPAGASIAADLAEIEAETDGIAAIPTSNPSSSTIAAAVWDLATSGHTTSGTFGAAMNAAGSAGDPWATNLPGAYGAGTAGFIVGTNINATITSRMATYTQPTGFLAATFPATVASPTNITAGTITTATNLTNAVVLSVGDSPVLQTGTATAGGASTITIQTAVGTTADLTGCIIKITSGTGAKQTRIITGYVNGTLVVTVDRAWTTQPDATSVYAILFAESPALSSGLKVTEVSLVDTLTTYTGDTPQTGDSFARLGAPAGASIAADLAEIEGETDGIATVQTTVNTINATTSTNLDVAVSSRMATFTLPTHFSSLLISASGHISNVDTLTTYTGDTPQTGDSYAIVSSGTYGNQAIQVLIGAPAGGSVATALAEIEGETDGIAAIPTNPYTGTPPTVAQIATAVWQDTTAGDFANAGSPGKILVTQLGGTFTTNSSSVFTVPALANAPSGGGGGGTVTGYATGQDPATLVLGALGSSWNTTGTIGHLINASGSAADPLLNIVVGGGYASRTAGAVLGALSPPAVTIASPVSSDGSTITIQAGDDYQSADGTAIVITDTGDTWPSSVGAVLELRVGPNDSIAELAYGVTIGTGGPHKTATIEFTSAQTLALHLQTYYAALVLTLANGDQRTVSKMQLVVQAR